jgi:hypothetical protein
MNISVLGLWRNSEKHIYKILSSLEDLTVLGNISFYFYENDSTDNTLSLLKQWMKDKKGCLFNEYINAPFFGSVTNIERLIFLSYYRNKAKELLSNTDSEYTLLMDTDVLFNNSHVLELVKDIKDTNAAMVVANTRQKEIPDLMYGVTTDSFYDVYPFRDSYNNNGLYFTDCPFILVADRNLWEKNQPIKINSGFSGFSLIKTTVLKKPNIIWSTCGHSEHVNFCSEIRSHGDIYISTTCCPITHVDPSRINIAAFTETAKKQIHYLNQINNIFNYSVSKTLDKNSNEQPNR